MSIDAEQLDKVCFESIFYKDLFYRSKEIILKIIIFHLNFQIHQETIARIEAASDEYARKCRRRQFNRQLVVNKVPRHVLLKPEHASTRLQGQSFKLGDRVVFVQDSGRVPIAAKGTVIGIEKSDIDVLFDDTFMSGSTLGDRLVFNIM